jgi:hypothetical protein
MATCAINGAAEPYYMSADQAKIDIGKNMQFEVTPLPRGGSILTCDPALVDSL